MGRQRETSEPEKPEATKAPEPAKATEAPAAKEAPPAEEPAADTGPTAAEINQSDSENNLPSTDIVVDESVAADGKNYRVLVGRISHSQNDGTTFSWSEGDIIENDGSKIPASEVENLVAQGAVEEFTEEPEAAAKAEE